MQPATSGSTHFTPPQIRRLIVDFDQQIRDGLEDGDIRKVMKSLAADLVSVALISRFR